MKFLYEGYERELDSCDESIIPGLIRREELSSTGKAISVCAGSNFHLWYTAWERLKPDVVNFLEESKKDRLWSIRKRVIPARHDTLERLLLLHTDDANELLPTAADYLLMEPFRSLIVDTPIDQELVEEDSYSEFSLLEPLARLFNSQG